MKKKLISIIAGIAIAALVLPMAIGVGAMEVYGILSGSSFSSFISYIAFHNAKDENTFLYVKKQVENADESKPAPEDDEFEFVLKLNGSVAQYQHYTLFDADGKRIYVYDGVQTTEEDPNQFEDELKTDRYGKFVLKAGQQARFDGLAVQDNYEVEEIPLDPYIQTSPEGGASAIGTLEPSGANEIFRNLYPATKEFQVRKSIVYPANYELPETPDFTFEVKIDGKLYANQGFIVKDLKTDQKLSEATTDENGRFTLKGDTYAVFQNVPQDTDYSVEEILGEGDENIGWRIVGDAIQEGATAEDGGAVVNFTNAYASFEVSKKMFGGITADASFEFQVTTANGKQSFGEILNYYLYDKNNQLVDEELHQTDVEGYFILKDGQKAVFVGLEPGTEYGVKETNSGKYIQYLPAAGQGYTDKVVSDSVEELPFINAITPSETLLTVRKSVVDNSEDGSAPNRQFMFRISKWDEETQSYVPAANEAYDITDATGTGTYSADEAGRFYLYAGETARFVKLKKGDKVMVEELTPDPAVFATLASGKQRVEIERIVATETEPFHIDVAYPSSITSDQLTLVLLQQTATDTYVPVSGVKYIVTEGALTGSEGTTGSDGSFTMQRDGKVSFSEGIDPEAIYLVETAETVKHKTDYGNGGRETSFEQSEGETINLQVNVPATEDIASYGSGDPIVFVIKKLNPETGDYEPFSGASYRLGNGVSSTDDSGKFVVKKGIIAVFENIPAGTYFIEQSIQDSLRGFTLDGDAQVEVGTIDVEAQSVTFTNNYDSPDNPLISIIKKNVNGDILSGAQLQLIKKHGDEETIVRSWVSETTPEQFQLPEGYEPGIYYIREIEAPKGYIVADDVRIRISNTSDIQEFSMTDKRDTKIPTGLEFFRRPIIRILIVLVIALGALAAVYFGIIRKRKKS